MRTRRGFLADEAKDAIDDAILCIAVPSRSQSAPPVARRKRSRIHRTAEEPVECLQAPEKKKEREYRRGKQHQDMELAVRAVEENRCHNTLRQNTAAFQSQL
jgi:hypothetical protein